MGELLIGEGVGGDSTFPVWVLVEVGALVEFVSVGFSVSSTEGNAEMVG